MLLIDPQHARGLLGTAHLMLVFTPELCAGRDPFEVLDAALPHLDIVQIRPKPLGGQAQGITPARAAFDDAVRVLELVAARPALDVLVTVNDRVDVAVALAERGLAGVHLGQGDCPVREARELLGADPLLGYSTHSMDQIGAAEDLPVDYLGFGPIHATETKGYGRGLGPEIAWVADSAAGRPVFPIGGIDRENIQGLAPVGRAAVGSAILAADDPGTAARELRALLCQPY